MLLRWIVNNYLRDAAEGKVREVVGGMLKPAAGGARPPQAERAEPAVAGDEADPGAAQPPVEIIPCDVVFIFGSGAEAGGLIDLLEGSERSKHAHGIEHAGKLAGREVVVVESGVGLKATKRAVTEAVKFYQPRWVIAAGFAAALNDDLKRGHLVIAEEAANAAGETVPLAHRFDPQSLAASVHVGRVLSVEEVVRQASERQQLAAQQLAAPRPALACDMESFAVAQACQAQGTRLLIVRIITDALDDELPPEIANLLAQKTWAAKVGATAGALLNRFSAAKDMWQMREQALKASDRLAKFLKSVLAQLPP
jgi:adenosylhomocysteine nucleosidase